MLSLLRCAALRPCLSWLQVGLMVDRYRNMSQPDWQHR
jgi:hypothetical protein